MPPSPSPLGVDSVFVLHASEKLSSIEDLDAALTAFSGCSKRTDASSFVMVVDLKVAFMGLRAISTVLPSCVKLEDS